MLEHGDEVMVKIGNGIIEMPGKIVAVYSNGRYSVFIRTKSHKAKTLHDVRPEDLRLTRKTEVIL